MSSGETFDGPAPPGPRAACPVALALFAANLVACNLGALVFSIGGLRFTNLHANAVLVILAMVLPVVVATATLTRAQGDPVIPRSGVRIVAIPMWIAVQAALGFALCVPMGPILIGAFEASNRLAHTAGIPALGSLPCVLHGALVVALWLVRRPGDSTARWLVLACGWITPTLLLGVSCLTLVYALNGQDGSWHARPIRWTANSYFTVRKVPLGHRSPHGLRLLAVTEFVPGVEWWRMVATDPALPHDVTELERDGDDLIARRGAEAPVRIRLR